MPLGIVVFFIGRRLLPDNPFRDNSNLHPRRYDWLSAAENIITFGLIFYALGSLARKGDLHVAIILLAVGIAIGVIYVRRQLHRDNPMLPVDLFRYRSTPKASSPPPAPS